MAKGCEEFHASLRLQPQYCFVFHMDPVQVVHSQNWNCNLTKTNERHSNLIRTVNHSPGMRKLSKNPNRELNKTSMEWNVRSVVTAKMCFWWVVLVSSSSNDWHRVDGVHCNNWSNPQFRSIVTHDLRNHLFAMTMEFFSVNSIFLGLHGLHMQYNQRITSGAGFWVECNADACGLVTYDHVIPSTRCCSCFCICPGTNTKLHSVQSTFYQNMSEFHSIRFGEM